MASRCLGEYTGRTGGCADENRSNAQAPIKDLNIMKAEREDNLTGVALTGE